MGKFVALLRGINVGGKNIIAKDDLRRCFEDLGYENVRTYIQSGNILFRSTKTRVADLTDDVEAALSKRFGYDAQAVVIPHKKFRAMVDAAPPTWGRREDAKHNALFTMRTSTPKRIIAALPEPKADIEEVTAANGVIFWSVDKATQTRSTLMRLAQNPAYQQVTVRNHNTVFKLLALFDEI